MSNIETGYALREHLKALGISFTKGSHVVISAYPDSLVDVFEWSPTGSDNVLSMNLVDSRGQPLTSMEFYDTLRDVADLPEFASCVVISFSDDEIVEVDIRSPLPTGSLDFLKGYTLVDAH